MCDCVHSLQTLLLLLPYHTRIIMLRNCRIKHGSVPEVFEVEALTNHKHKSMNITAIILVALISHRWSLRWLILLQALAYILR